MTLEQLLALLGDGTPGLPKPAPSMPIPLAPVNNIGPLRDDTSLAFAAQNPEPVPPRFVQPAAADTGFVDRYSGQVPTPPAPLSRAQRIFNAIGGFAAGVEGRGGEYLEQLRQPQRQYERQQAAFEERRTRAIELAERRAEREAEQANRANELAYERDFKVWLQKNNTRDDEAKQRMAQAFTLERDARAARIEEEKEQRRDRARREDDARSIAGRLGTGPGAAPPHIAKELGEFYANVRQTVSPASAKWQNAQARRAELLARPALGGGSAAASRRETLDLQRRTAQAAAGKGQMERLAASEMQKPEAERPPILNQMRSMAQTLQAQFPEIIETGTHNNWPFARLKLRGGQQQQQQQAAPDPLGILHR